MPAVVSICAAFALAGSARAQDDEVANGQYLKVAVIDLSEDDSVKLLGEAIHSALNHSDVLRNPDNRYFDSLLTGPLADEDQRPIRDARLDLATAESALEKPDPKGAETLARQGQELLAGVTPGAEVQALYADLSLVRGLALLDMHRAQDANFAFAFTHRLDPAR